MIRVKKDFNDIPKILLDSSREEAFEANIRCQAYCDKKNRYKSQSVLDRLKKIYNLKCAYCEKRLLDSPKHIEHYRPKKIYYWLAYSWDNLLLSCGSCNSAKGDRFEIANKRQNYRGESFSQIHSLGSRYDKSEKPLIINPERDDILEYISFDKKGYIYSENERVKYTIEKACNLNRVELVQLRQEIIMDFIYEMNSAYFYFIKHKDITIFIPSIERFIKDYRVENQFFALRHYIIHHSEVFFDDNPLLQKIVKKLLKRVK